ncbi:16S rRNA (uracil(1498)-N(3))-methyltransferase [Leptospira sp. GIMC2001]|uniref:16S rRNA (uracil(1498)-N(3))-methyltransferase n=1 Tax=Leptospira sp. GIMC2001 TaxID=1513297 RepID=UPI00234A799F|nr:RsmE family RNA methyltransferase [Leptospira sp. GIMC2001]WCL48339.1 RsmE family RNA methyltransferase [Leptospira sp. GIMC2001]
MGAKRDKLQKLETVLFFRRNFVPTPADELTGFEITHLKSLRLFNADKYIEIRDGNGRSYTYLCDVGSKKLIPAGILTDKLEQKNKSILAGAIPKGNRLEWLLQKGTELGVTEFHFCNFERSVRLDFSLERTERILAEAATQSKRMFLPDVTLYKDWEDLVVKIGKENFYILDPRSEVSFDHSKVRNKIAIIGPEGGFGSEIGKMQAINLPAYRLGEEILRMETAYIFIASINHYNNLLSFD